MVGQIAMKLSAWALAEQIRKWDRAGQPAAVARKSEEQRLARRTPAETKLPTNIGELKNQNVRLRIGKAFLSYLKAHPHVRGSGACLADIDTKKLPWGACAKSASRHSTSTPRTC